MRKTRHKPRPQDKMDGEGVSDSIHGGSRHLPLKEPPLPAFPELLGRRFPSPPQADPAGCPAETLCALVGLGPKQTRLGECGISDVGQEIIRGELERRSDMLASCIFIALDPSDKRRHEPLVWSLMSLNIFTEAFCDRMRIRPWGPDGQEKLRGAVKELVDGLGPAGVERSIGIMISRLEDGKPSKIVYKQLVIAYARILDDCERAGKTSQLLDEFLAPPLAFQEYLDRAKVRELMKAVPEGRLGPLDRDLLDRTLSKGVSGGDLADLRRLVHEKDAVRNQFHDIIRDYASALGLSDLDILADISLAYNGSPLSKISPGSKSLVVTVGSLMAVPLSAQGFVSYSEWSDAYESDSAASREIRKRLDRCVKEILEIRAKDRSDPRSGTYMSHIGHSEDESEDLRTLCRIMETNPDVPMKAGFELSHSQHGAIVMVLRLCADLGGIEVKQESIESILDRLMSSIRDSISQAMQAR